ncbi:hypothetical protein JOC77_002592 [Peribacillus deserti]|uniref:Abortive phage infection protein n=1 Tax=Peribacillus deserti TaxID=673318 RepID=A0ABS2QJ18_9BACI|nr:hypothetical protein [Peribacillus deserti]MBM7693153.1 hypothetical protein [Peribacillus deserti]
MDKNLAQELLNKLANRELNEVTVSKDSFLVFRDVIVKREDFKHFRGIAQHNGEVIYQYLDEPRS